MKFVIRSLLFVNLLLQMTNSLKSCFDHDQNIMITIILLAFSVIGLIGLVIGNRFILIIFSASMTLILIASITIYAIERTGGEDSMRPKVPYYTNLVPEDQDAYGRTLSRQPLSRGSGRDEEPSEMGDSNINNNNNNKLKSFVDGWLSKNNEQAARNKNTRYNKTRASLRANSSRMKAAQRKLLAATKTTTTTTTTTRAPEFVDELSDEPTSLLLHDETVQHDGSLAPHPAASGSIINARSPLGASLADGQMALNRSSLVLGDVRSAGKAAASLQSADNLAKAKGKLNQVPPPPPPPRHSPAIVADQTEPDGFAGEQVESEQWVAYERYLYERYLNILSQSIDLILHSILAAWMALLLDEDSDQCFGPKTSSASGRRGTLTGSGRQTSSAKEAPVYNYKGVRYSIRPDVDDSPTHIVVH